MTEIVSDCPRCKASRVTFSLLSWHLFNKKHRWQHVYEAFGLCRHCSLTTVFILSQKDINTTEYFTDREVASLNCSLNKYFNVDGFVSLKDFGQRVPPEHLPPDILSIFQEGAKCMAVECFNAGATMFRLCIDLATTNLIPVNDIETLNARTRRSLGRRLQWMFDNGKLPEALRDLSVCVKDGGDDGAHSGNITKEEAVDLVDFTHILLERLYTDSAKLRIANERRINRRANQS